MTRFTPLAAFVALLLGVTSAGAQMAPPAHISVVDGSATVSRTSGSELAVPDLPLDPGDRVRTGDGHVEIITGDDAILHLDAQTTIDVNATGIVRLLGGRIVVAAAPAGNAVQVDALPATVRLSVGSEGRLSLYQDADGVYLDVAMIRGDAALITSTSATSVFAGSRVVVRNGQASEEMAFNSAETDPFYDWSNALLDERRGTTSAQYLPSDLSGYGASFDEGGSWNYQEPYGYVWYPTVAVGWRPYFHGRWCWRDGGWNFVGDGGRWNYPTHHYGRWGVGSGGGWFWVPGKQWSSAWVQWASAPGYVSWSPLGANDRPVGTWASRTDTHSAAPGRGWTVVRSTTFSDGGNVSRHAVDTRALASAQTLAFVQQATPPPSAVSRGHFGVAGPSVRADARAVPRAAENNVPARAARVMTPPAASAPSVVYYRGGTVTTGPSIGPSTDAHAARSHTRDAAASRGMTVGGVQPPPIPYRNGPPIIAVPRATPPGGGHFGPPIIAGPPPLIGAPTTGPPAAHAVGGAIAHPAPPHPAPAPAPAPAPSGAAPAHAVASPRGGSPR
jgi:hypothetical protein